MTKIIIAVFDGLQPTQIDQTNTPNIYRISQEGCFFENHHPVFPSVTRINAATMVTGVGPDVHGLPGNMLVALRTAGEAFCGPSDVIPIRIIFVYGGRF